MAAGWTLSRPGSSSRALATQALLFVLLANAPDLDLLIGRHGKETHSIGAAVIVASVAAWRRWPLAATPARIWLVAFAAWFTHPMLDALAFDQGPPIGVMVFWPFSSEHWHSGFAPFDAIERNWTRPRFLPQNVMALVRELAILGPILAAVWWVRKPKPDRH